MEYVIKIGKEANLSDEHFVETSNGWVKAKDLKVRDEVISFKGEIHSITAISGQGKSDRIKSLFETYFDGCYDVEPQLLDGPSTFSMGVCKLEFVEKTNTLTVHLRRPGVLIGRAGRVINGLKKFLECEIGIVEVKKF